MSQDKKVKDISLSELSDTCGCWPNSSSSCQWYECWILCDVCGLLFKSLFM